MSKDKFITLQSTAVPMPIENIDTDQIIPARFLKATTRTGFGENLFCDWRFDADRKPLTDFVLNNTAFRGKILVAGKNFGCGSSREHAAWAIYDYGFRVVISSFFADIFSNNALNNGLLPVVVPEDFLQRILSRVVSEPSTLITVDLANQKVLLGGESVPFEINAYKKTCLMNGYDDIDYLLSLRGVIKEYDRAHAV